MFCVSQPIVHHAQKSMTTSHFEGFILDSQLIFNYGIYEIFRRRGLLHST